MLIDQERSGVSIAVVLWVRIVRQSPNTGNQSRKRSRSDCAGRAKTITGAGAGGGVLG